MPSLFHFEWNSEGVILTQMFEYPMIFGEDGVKATVIVATEWTTMIYVTLAIFVGITLALIVAKKVAG